MKLAERSGEEEKAIQATRDIVWIIFIQHNNFRSIFWIFMLQSQYFFAVACRMRFCQARGQTFTIISDCANNCMAIADIATSNKWVVSSVMVNQCNGSSSSSFECVWLLRKSIWSQIFFETSV